jgi:hypothetical protein
MVYFTNNKKLNIKINILLAAFLEDEFYDNEICINEINKSFKESIGIWVSIYNITDSIYCPVIHINHDDKCTVIYLDKIKLDNKTICFKTGLKIILAYICYLASDNKHSVYNIVEHESLYMRAINEIIDTCESIGIDLKANYNKYHATIDCYFPDLIESILI